VNQLKLALDDLGEGFRGNVFFISHSRSLAYERIVLPGTLSVMNLEAAIKDIQDTLVVMAHIEQIHAKITREHAEHLAELIEARRRTELKLAEAADKLDGLIGYVDHQSATLRQRPGEAEELLEFRRRTEQNLAEITEKLNRMSGPPLNPS